MTKHIVIVGATGMLGKKIVATLHKKNIDVVVVSRSPEKSQQILPYAQHHVAWDGKNPGEWQEYFDQASAVINLAGSSVADGRWTQRRKQSILESRVDGTRIIVNTLLSMQSPPALINASAVGIYGNTGDTVCDENSANGKSFLANVCHAWENEAYKARAKTRVVTLRIGVVLDPSGGALQKMILPFSAFLGGPLGSGKQWFPWIHRDDVASMFVWACQQQSIDGAFNCTAPKPLRMNQFATALGKALHRPSWLRVPESMLRVLLGKQHEIVTSGQNISAEKAMKSGFIHTYAEIDAALTNLLSQ